MPRVNVPKYLVDPNGVVHIYQNPGWSCNNFDHIERDNTLYLNSIDKDKFAGISQARLNELHQHMNQILSGTPNMCPDCKW